MVGGDAVDDPGKAYDVVWSFPVDAFKRKTGAEDDPAGGDPGPDLVAGVGGVFIPGMPKGDHLLKVGPGDGDDGGGIADAVGLAVEGAGSR